jgi:hypothetical protein
VRTFCPGGADILSGGTPIYIYRDFFRLFSEGFALKKKKKKKVFRA